MSDPNLFKQLAEQMLEEFESLSSLAAIDQFLQTWQTKLTSFQEQLSVDQFRLLLLFLFGLLGEEAAQLGDKKKEFEFYQQGLAVAQQWLKKADFTDHRLQDRLLSLCSSCGNAAARLGDNKKAFELYQQGFAVAQRWSPATFTEHPLQTSLLNLYVNCGVVVGRLGDNKKKFELYQQGIAVAQQWSPAIFTDHELQTSLLKLYTGYGVTAGQLGNYKKAFELFQHGVAVAQQWLKKGELSTENYERILGLINNQTVAENSLFQRWIEVGYFSWRAPEEVLQPFDNDPNVSWFSQHWTKLRKNKVEDLTKKSLRFWEQLLDWHSLDEKPVKHRHIPLMGEVSPTEQLLKLSQSLYLLERLEDRTYLLTAYHTLKHLDDSLEKLLKDPFYKTYAEKFLNPLNQLKQQLEIDWKVIFPNTPFDLKQCSTLPPNFLRKCFYFQRLNKLKQNHQDYQTLSSRRAEEIFDCHKNYRWDQSLTKMEGSLVDWLMIYLNPSLKYLNELNYELLVELHKKHFFQLQLSEKMPDVLKHKNLLEQLWENKIFAEVLKRHPHEIQYEIKEKLSSHLQNAWFVLSENAKQLAAYRNQLNDVNLNKPISKTYRYSNADFIECFEASLKQKPQDYLKSLIRKWFGLKGNPHSLEPKQAVEYYRDLFERCLQVVPYQYRSNYDQKLHSWTKVALNETLQHQPLNLVKIFNYLEDSRIALHSRDINIDKWFKDTDDALLKSLYLIKDRLSKHKQRPIKSNEPCPLLVTWIERLQRLLPTFEIADIQGKLRPAEIIIQPFFDDILESWRLLCLDQHGLQLIDFNEKINFNEISLHWDKQLDISRQTQRRDCQTRELPNLKAILENKTVQTVAAFLCDLAQQKGLQRLTVIFPAPLNQFPWEAVSNELAQYLVREISIQHWLDQHFSSTVAQPSYWLTADPSGEAQYMVKEIEWLEEFLKQTQTVVNTTKPCNRYELLKQLQTSHHLHFATHGVFEINNPFKSYLTLDSSKEQYISLWLLSLLKTHADVIILSACESCLTGKETHGLINPVGLAPTLASMGAKTVIGTLWACDGLAAWFFNYFFYKFAQEFPQESYHLILNRTREKLKSLPKKELSRIAKAEKLYDDLCEKSVSFHQALKPFPFEHPYYWAGFVMLGETQRS